MGSLLSRAESRPTKEEIINVGNLLERIAALETTPQAELERKLAHFLGQSDLDKEYPVIRPEVEIFMALRIKTLESELADMYIQLNKIQTECDELRFIAVPF